MESLRWLKFLLKEARVERLNPAEFKDTNEFYREFIKYYKNNYCKKQIINMVKTEVLNDFKKIPKPVSTEIIKNIKEGDLSRLIPATQQSTLNYLDNHFYNGLRADSPLQSLGYRLYIFILEKVFGTRFSDADLVQTFNVHSHRVSNFYYDLCLKYPNKSLSLPRLNIGNMTQTREHNLKIIEDRIREELNVIEPNSILDDVKITEYISNGLYGTVFKLEGDRVIKIFADSISLQKDLN